MSDAVFKGPVHRTGRNWIGRRLEVAADVRFAAGHTERGTLRRLILSSRLPLLGFAVVGLGMTIKAFLFYRAFGQSPWPIGTEYVEFFLRFWPGRILLAAQIGVLIFNYLFSVRFQSRKGNRWLFSAVVRRQLK